MQLRTLIGICGLALAMSACGDEGSDVGPVELPSEFRAGPPPWAGAPGYPGYGDLSIHIGEDTAEDDCLVWDFQGSVVVNGAATGAPEGGPLIELTADGDVVVGDEVTCAVESYPQWNLSVLRDGDTGQVLYTAFNQWVFEGSLYGLNGPQIAQQLRYTWRKEQIREGGWWGTPILTADAHIGWAKADRKLVTTAAIDGACGTPGLAAYPIPPNTPPPPDGTPNGG